MSDSSDEVEVEEHDVVRVNGCDIYYYGDVDTENTLEFLDEFKKLEVDLLKKSIELPGYKPTIRVHIHSDGGDVFSGLSIMDTLKSSRVNIVTIAEGTCCSAATFIFIGWRGTTHGEAFLHSHPPTIFRFLWKIHGVER